MKRSFFVRRWLIVALVASVVAGITAVALPGPALCLPPACRPPLSPAWPFGPAGLSAIRIVSVFAFFLLAAILVGAVVPRRVRWPSRVVGVPLAIVLSAIVIGGASPIGRWYTPSGAAASTSHPFVLSVSTGSSHCGWQDVAFLGAGAPLLGRDAAPFASDRGPRMYVWQTGTAYPPGGLATRPGTVAAVPADARDTGFHRGSWHLWVAPSRLSSAVYLTSGQTVERWAFASRLLGCE